MYYYLLLSFRVLFKILIVCSLGIPALATQLQAQSFSDVKFSHLSIRDGLSNNQVNAIWKDRRGLMWFGTISGLNRYDGNSFRVFRHTTGDTTSLDDNTIETLFEDHLGNLWINTRVGVNIFLPEKEYFLHDHAAYLEDSLHLPSVVVNKIYADPQGNFWYLTDSKGVFVYQKKKDKTMKLPDTEAGSGKKVSDIQVDDGGQRWLLYTDGMIEQRGKDWKVLARFDQLANFNHRDEMDYRFMQDKTGAFWIYPHSQSAGIYRYDLQKDHITHVHENSSPLSLNTNIVTGMLQDQLGRVWVATDHGGVNLINWEMKQVHYLTQQDQNELSLSQNSINCLYQDREGMIWIGTYKNGVSYYHPNLFRFPLFTHNPADSQSLPFKDVNCFEEDKKGNLWIGTNGGGLLYFDRDLQSFTQYTNDPDNPASISNNVVVSLTIDHQGDLWVGTYHGGLNRFDGKEFHHYRHQEEVSSSISDDRVWSLYEDQHQRLWIGTLGNGLDRYDRQTDTFIHYKTANQDAVHSDYISEIIEDHQGWLWLGGAKGVEVLDPETRQFTRFTNQHDSETALNSDLIFVLYPDQQGRIWVGTKQGLNLFDEKTQTFLSFTKEDGLPDDMILTILEDDAGHFWVSTPHGLSDLGVYEEKGQRFSEVKDYSASDGLQDIEFNENAALKTTDGALVFGGPNGFNLFHPDQIRMNRQAPEVVLTDLQIFGERIATGQKLHGRVLLENAIGLSDHIILKPEEDMVTFDFAALNYFQSGKNRFAYKLEGFNDQWIMTDGKVPSATYTNLTPGQYTFVVKGANNDGIWNEHGTRLAITVLPPFWKTSWAMLLYAFLILVALLIARKLTLERARMNFQLAQQKQEAQRIKELDLMKTRFFTNVSHEFRTPLTLIISPLERMLTQLDEGDRKNHLELVYRNARRLLTLVNQLLDFRKMEVQEVKLNASEGDIIRYIKEVVASFEDLSENKNVHLTFHSAISHLKTRFDEDKLEKILFNLLSNAFKFTPEGGEVYVNLFLQQDHQLAIQVKDTGIGIPENKLEKVFDKFFQSDSSGPMVNQGSGIGLSITKEFVRLHQGEIMVDSTEGKGATFTVSLPVSESAQVEEVSQETEVSVVQELPELSEDHVLPEQKETLPLLLLVEDSEDFRFYLKDNLKGQYRVEEAANGQEGWKLAKKLIPDLIVSDVMMPLMNGIDLCKKVKKDPRTSHIPLVLLTARTQDAQQLQGLQEGADDYVTKPFNFAILESRLSNLVKHRENWKARFHEQLDVEPSEIDIPSADKTLIDKAIKLVEEHIDDSEFSVEQLSHELGFSRVHLYKKLTGLTGKTPIEFIRFVRLKRASQLLEKSQLTIAEIAYQVGFNNPKYFTKQFKAEFRELPSAYAARFRG